MIFYSCCNYRCTTKIKTKAYIKHDIIFPVLQNTSIQNFKRMETFFIYCAFKYHICKTSTKSNFRVQWCQKQNSFLSHVVHFNFKGFSILIEII